MATVGVWVWSTSGLRDRRNSHCHGVPTLPTACLLEIQTEIIVQGDDDGTTPSPTPTPSPSTVPTTRVTEDGQLIVEVGELGWVEIPAQSVDLSETGCGAIGCLEEYTRVSRGCDTKRGVVVCVRVCRIGTTPSSLR